MWVKNPGYPIKTRFGKRKDKAKPVENPRGDILFDPARHILTMGPSGHFWPVKAL